MADNPYFRNLEDLADGSALPLAEVLDELAFNDAGLVPVIAQDHATGQVLMLAWMNRQSLDQTIASGKMTYWSRSRQSLWLKGETSGHFQRVVSMHFDCDGDALLCRVEQIGAACHTGRSHCFYLDVDGEQVTVKVPQPSPSGDDVC